MPTEREIEAAKKSICCPYIGGCLRPDDCLAKRNQHVSKQAKFALEAAERERNLISEQNIKMSKQEATRTSLLIADENRQGR